MNSAYAGRYKLQVINLDGSLKHDSGWFDNLITNAGLNTYGGIVANTFRAYIGTGSSVAETDTSMGAVATTTSYTRQYSYQETNAPYWGRERFVFSFPIGAYVGAINDVGIGWGTGVASFTPLYSHALLPSPITLGSIDQVILTYDHYYCVSAAAESTFELNGVLTTCICKPVIPKYDSTSLATPGNVYNFSENIYAQTQFFSGFVLAPVNNLRTIYTSYTTFVNAPTDTSITNAYTPGSNKISYSKTWNAEKGNYTNINGFMIYSHPGRFSASGFAGSLNPPFTKSNLQKLTLQGEATWARTAVPE